MIRFTRWKPFELLISDEMAQWIGDNADRFLAACVFCEIAVSEVAMQIQKARRNGK